ncbi:exonuclease SbcCD subunit D [Mycetocola sp. 2940]|uniref:exonuclease SbcCD subunit D n=1 Tax=Mycetocola sp. 2940 TaxID=3156452 RepID=UPI00339A01EF
MRILHTSDWHIGRTFHGHSTLANLRSVLAALAVEVRERSVDVVVVAGDIFDSATPAAEAYTVLESAVVALREAGASVVLTSGNHDSATRLGFMSRFSGLAGVHVVTRQEQHDQPITLADEHGPVHVYGIPYLEPSLLRHHYPDAALRTHEQVLTFVMDRIRADLARRGGRSVVLSHCFAVNVAATDADATNNDASGHGASDVGASKHRASQHGASDVGASQHGAGDVERDITSGGLDYVPLSVFDGPDYVALGHIHGRAALSDRARYSGAPLHYSFSEAAKPRGAWLVDLDASGLASVGWVELPVPRPLAVVTGVLDEILSDPALGGVEASWLSVVLTDNVRPLDGMRRLQARFPHCVTLEHRPAVTAAAAGDSYAERVKGQSDLDIVAGFLSHVRNGVGPTDIEKAIVAEVLAEVERAEHDEPAADDRATAEPEWVPVNA